MEFERGIVAAERPYDPTLKNGDIHYYDLVQLIRSTSAEVLVAQVDGEIVGSGYAKLLPAEPYQDFDTYAHLGFMYVKPEFRGRGINQLVLNGLISWAKGMGISEIRLEVYDGNMAAKTAYLKAGFTPNLLKMRMKV